MYAQALISLVLATRIVAAIEFADYDPQPGVQAEFKPFFEALVNAAEDPDVTMGYTDYFPADGLQTTLSLHCVGAAGIQKCKDGFLADGRQLVHWPNITFIAGNNETATVYEAQGRIKNTYIGGNCSQIYYKTQYTVLKTEKGVDAAPNLNTTAQQQVYWYHDYYINPTTVPSNIPCDSRTKKRRFVEQEWMA
ncbi:uncharacterized protein BCR38DRAFT_459361 [Pseudomassariella vexata]|uniref:Uncharacterized protein n=1 Tax=Pseudomassariella vexata TaxID=1141098 RepID=A0A1Y2DQS6_9PEZI|nr:uncharacterized protein BCR38DRAFT_459361 [Pseudomassariella vexata]ORY61494.1 hypothetical protein BCR38DRAFT_459361 [Pseudomassariella vexata]